MYYLDSFNFSSLECYWCKSTRKKVEKKTAGQDLIL